MAVLVRDTRTLVAFSFPPANFSLNLAQPKSLVGSTILLQLITILECIKTYLHSAQWFQSESLFAKANLLGFFQIQRMPSALGQFR